MAVKSDENGAEETGRAIEAIDHGDDDEPYEDQERARCAV